MKWYCVMVLTYTFLITDEAEHLFINFWPFGYPFFVKVLSLLPIFLFACFFPQRFVGFPYKLDMSRLLDRCVTHIFSHCVD